MVGSKHGVLQAGRDEFRVLNLARAIRINIVENYVDKIVICLRHIAAVHELPKLLSIDRSVFVSINHLKELA